MNDLTQVLTHAAQGDPDAAEKLLPLVYEELRKLAGARLAQVPPGNTLQATALVHEAFLRLVGSDDPGWNGRHHFFGAAAQAMRDILVEQARSKARLKRGGDRQRVDPDMAQLAVEPEIQQILAVDEALKQLEHVDARSVEIVMLKYFAGLTEKEIGSALGLSERTVRREWTFAKTWLKRALAEDPIEPGG